jgi:hypothetical protein
MSFARAAPTPHDTMNPYRSSQIRPSFSPRAQLPGGTLVLLILIAWIALGTSEPHGKDFILLLFTTALVVLAVLRRRGAPAPRREGD